MNPEDTVLNKPVTKRQSRVTLPLRVCTAVTLTVLRGRHERSAEWPPTMSSADTMDCSLRNV